MNTKIILTVLFIHIIFAANIYGIERSPNQIPADNRVLKLIHMKTGDFLIIRANETIKFRYNNKFIKANIDSISETQIFIKDKSFDIDKITFLFKEGEGKKNKVAGKILMTASTILIAGLAIRRYIFIQECERVNCEDSAYTFAFVLALFMAASFIFMFIPGIILSSVKDKHSYDLKRSWKIESVEESEIFN